MMGGGAPSQSSLDGGPATWDEEDEDVVSMHSLCNRRRRPASTCNRTEASDNPGPFKTLPIEWASFWRIPQTSTSIAVESTIEYASSDGVVYPRAAKQAEVASDILVSAICWAKRSLESMALKAMV